MTETVSQATEQMTSTVTTLLSEDAAALEHISERLDLLCTVALFVLAFLVGKYCYKFLKLFF